MDGKIYDVAIGTAGPSITLAAGRTPVRVADEARRVTSEAVSSELVDVFL